MLWQVVNIKSVSYAVAIKSWLLIYISHESNLYKKMLTNKLILTCRYNAYVVKKTVMYSQCKTLMIAKAMVKVQVLKILIDLKNCLVTQTI